VPRVSRDLFDGYKSVGSPEWISELMQGVNVLTVGGQVRELVAGHYCLQVAIIFQT
jgi:hypothetical protein